MTKMLSELVDTAPGFRAAVNLIQERDDFEKTAAFLPTAQAAEVLFDVGRQLEPKANERARMLTGAYGTGKSHLALVLAAIYRGYLQEVEPVLGRLAGPFPGQEKHLREELSAIDRDRPFLLVLVEGDQDSFDAALLRGLRVALEEAGLDDFMPGTYFSAAAARLRELCADERAAERVEEALPDLGFDSPDALLRELDSCSLEGLRRFRELHERVCFGAPAVLEAGIDAAETYRQAAEELVSSGKYLGIVVLWDEFGAFMEMVLRSPESVGLPVQRFAETCQNSAANQIHLYLIAHRTLPSYVRRAKDTMHLPKATQEAWEQDFRKVTGRFREFLMESRAEELFELIDQVVIQRVHDGWGEFAREREDEFVMLADVVQGADIFPDLPASKLRRIVVEGCYPLHPMTVAFLPRVSEIVAQNQRTLFTFICGNHQGTVAEFLRTTPVPTAADRLPMVAADSLWDYFDQVIREDQIGRQVYGLYRNAVATSEISREDRLCGRLLKVLGLFELVRRGAAERASMLPATEENLALALDLRSEAERSELQERLATLSRRGAGQVVVRTRDGVYRFVSGGPTDLRQMVEETIEQRAGSLDAAQFIRDRWGAQGRQTDDVRLGFEETVEALALSSDVISRTLDVVPVLAEEVDSLGRWLQDIGGGEFKDGFLFVTLPTEDVQLGVVSKAANSYADNLQVIMGRPRNPLRGLREAVARVDALEAIARDQPALWGKEGERHEEWQVEYDDAEQQLREATAPAGLAVQARELDMICIWRGEPHSVTSWAEVIDLANKAMATAFAKTPKTRDEVMRPPGKKDGLASARRAVLAKLLERNAADLLLREQDQAQARLARLLQSFGILRQRPRREIGRPSAEHDAGAAEAWDAIVAFRERVQEAARPLTELTDTLRAAPYGIGQRVLPLLFAAALREDIRTGNLALERERKDDWQTLQIDADTLDNAFQEPEKHRVRYVDVTEQQYLAVEGLLVAIAGEEAVPERRAELLQAARREITRWWSQLPGYCQQTASIGKTAKYIRDEVLRPLVHPDADVRVILVEQLRGCIEVREGLRRDDFAKAFVEVVAEIEGAVEGLQERVAGELLAELGMQGEATAEAVHAAIAEWYEKLPEGTRQYCHQGDAGKLQRCLREPGESFLETLCESVNGRPMRQWTDKDVGHFVGRMLSAKEDLERWEPPPPPPPPPPPSPGMAYLSITAEVGGEPIHVRRQFRTIPPEEFSEAAKVLLRLLRTNLLDDYSMRDGEKENILLELLRTIFGHD